MPHIQTIKARLAPVAWLLMALMTLAPLGPHVSNVVLCFGMDGHVEAEIEHAEDCVDVPIPTGNDAKCSSFKTESGPASFAIIAVAEYLPAPVHSLPPSPYRASCDVRTNPAPSQRRLADLSLS